MAKSNNYDSGSGSGSGSGSFTDDRSAALRERFAGISESASGQIDNSPLIALGAGLALGAVLGAVLPTSTREREVLGPLGTRITDAGTSAFDRAKDMSKQKFDDMAGDKLREVLGGSSSSSSGSSKA